MAPHVSVIILTFNEEIHIERCIRSAMQFTNDIYVVDSNSTDNTARIAAECGARVFSNHFISHAAQLQWALDVLPISTTWIMRLDADEVVSAELAAAIRVIERPPRQSCDGFLVTRFVEFQGKVIKHGGFPQRSLRLWKQNRATVEQRWMDEHVLLRDGTPRLLPGALIDANLNGITWWTSKHNGYASKEAVEMLNLKYGFRSSIPSEGVLETGARRKRQTKENIYRHLPLGLRAVIYFAFRMFPQLGILDGPAGFKFHFLQGLWYRFLVDLKINEVENCMNREGVDCKEAVRRVLGVVLP